ncbi:MAG: VOC family protein [Ruminococcaceae bacterium]|nr:VOC family protein [Oscillospiraceae bacterium]
MKITTFNPLIITRDPDATIELFEQLGFEQHHVKDNISEIKTTDVRLKNENGFYVDVAQGDGEYTMIRVNVDNFDEAIAFFMDHGFRKPNHKRASKTVRTRSSQYTMLVSPSGYILAVSQHIKDKD